MTLKLPAPPCPGFEEFWAVYPRRTAKSVAQASWNKLAPSEDLRRTIKADVVRKSQTWRWRKDDGEFIPFPATYLNQRRWEDEIVLAVPDPPPKPESLCVVTACEAVKVGETPWCAEHLAYREKALGLTDPQP